MHSKSNLTDAIADAMSLLTLKWCIQFKYCRLPEKTCHRAGNLLT